MKVKAFQLAATLTLVCGMAQAAGISWGAASSFAVLGGSTVTSTGNTVVDGDLGVSPGTEITGFSPPGVVTGTTHAGDAIANQAHADAATLSASLKLLAVDTNLSGTDLGSLTLAPGVYQFTASAQLTGNLVLDGSGQYVFLIGSTLTTGTGAEVQMINGASWENVVFVVGSSATLGAGTLFGGSILADTSITLVTGTTLDGRAIALGGAVTMDTNTVTVGVIPEPATASLLAVGLSTLLIRRRRIKLAA